MNPAETYKVDANNPPHLNYAHDCKRCFFVRAKHRVNGKIINGWALKNIFNQTLNFIPDGTDWIK